MNLQNKNQNEDPRFFQEDSSFNQKDSFLKENSTATQEDSDLSPVVFSWQAKEYEFQEKDKSWYWKMGGVFLAGILMGVFTKNILTAITFLLFGFVFYLYSKRSPQEVEVVLTERGVQVAEVFYEYRALKSFWVFYDGTDNSYISFIRKNKMLPSLDIPTGGNYPEEARKILKNFLPEKKQAEDLASVLEKKLKF